jgi:folate-binding protein YgfZ
MAMTQSITMTPMANLTLVEVTGDDRATWLQGLITQSVTELEPGQSRYGCVINLKGRVLADFQVGNDGERLLLGLPRDRAQSIVEHLEGRLITEDAEVADRSADIAVMTIQGSGASALIGLTTDCGAIEIGGVPCRGLSRSHTGKPGVDLFAPTPLMDTVSAALVGLGVVPLSLEALETQRVAAGIPLCGVDFDEAVIPLEARLNDAIHWGKGCYLGQEVLARLAHRGHTNKELRVLQLDELAQAGDEVWPAPTTDNPRNKPVGRVTSVATTQTGVMALAYVRRKHFEPGTELELRGAAKIRAVVSEQNVRAHITLTPENDPDFQGKGNRVHRALV